MIVPHTLHTKKQASDERGNREFDDESQPNVLRLATTCYYSLLKAVSRSQNTVALGPALHRKLEMEALRSIVTRL